MSAAVHIGQKEELWERGLRAGNWDPVPPRLPLSVSLCQVQSEMRPAGLSLCRKHGHQQRRSAG